MPAGSVRPHGALPAFYELPAPKAWRAIDFISDLHLSPALPRTVEVWARHLRETSADAVFMLGDLFEVWVGDDAGTLPFERHCIDVIAEASSRRSIGFMVGNRDFLLGARTLREGGMMGLPDPTVLIAWGQRVLLTHGDSLCLDDTDYQAFRREVRSVLQHFNHLYVFGTAGVATAAGQLCPVLAEQADAALPGDQHAGHQSQQRALAAAAGAVQEDGAAGGDVQPVDGQARAGRAGPGVVQVADLDQGGAIAPGPRATPGAPARPSSAPAAWRAAAAGAASP